MFLDPMASLTPHIPVGVGAGGSGPAVEVAGQFLPPDTTSSSVVAKE